MKQQRSDSVKNPETGKTADAARGGDTDQGGAAAQHAPPHSPTGASSVDNENDVIGEGLEALADYLVVGELVIGWSKNIGQIASMELERSVIALKNILGFKICMLPMLLLLHLSLCGSVAYVAYAEMESVYAGLVVFLLAQMLGIFYMRRMITYNRSLVGFEHTKKHTLKAKNDIVNAFK